MNQVTTGRLFFLFIQYLAIIERFLGKILNEYIERFFLSFFLQAPEEDIFDMDTVDIDRTEDGWFDLSESEDIPSLEEEPEFTQFDSFFDGEDPFDNEDFFDDERFFSDKSLIDGKKLFDGKSLFDGDTFFNGESFFDGERLARVFEDDGVDEYWFQQTTRIHFTKEPARSMPEAPAAPNKPLPALPAASQSTAQRDVQTQTEETTNQLEDEAENAMSSNKQNLIVSDAGTHDRERSLSWWEELGYTTCPEPAPITWERLVKDNVCLEGRGPFWEGEGMNPDKKGYEPNQAESAARLSPFSVSNRSAAWEAELKLFRKSHELSRADKEIIKLENKLQRAEAEATMYRDHLVNANLDLRYMEDQMRQSHVDLSGCRERLEYFEKVQGQWKADHAELIERRVDMQQLQHYIRVRDERLAIFEGWRAEWNKGYAELTESRLYIQDLEKENRELRACYDRVAILEGLQVEWKKEHDELVDARLFMKTVELDDAELRDSRERIADFARRQEHWEKDHAELVMARGYIKELEAKPEAAESKGSRKRKWQPEIPPRTEWSKSNEADYSRRRVSYDQFWALQGQ